VIKLSGDDLNSDDNPQVLITIVTVCLDAENTIIRTLDSLAKQRFDDYELLVIDGKSSDNTLLIIKSYYGKIKNIRIYSENDNGIYDAMNKGIRKAYGKYIYFLNSGDFLLSADSLELISKSIDSPDFDIYYFPVIKGQKIERYPIKLSFFWLIYLERMVCHQSIITKKNILAELNFDLDFKICADREWMIRIIRKGVRYKYIENVMFCIYDINGISSHYDSFHKDSLKIAKKFAGRKAVLFIILKGIIGLILGHDRKNDNDCC
jgi:glycosyltransferase involved in cell wall biosynthesis